MFPATRAGARRLRGATGAAVPSPPVERTRGRVHVAG